MILRAISILAAASALVFSAQLYRVTSTIEAADPDGLPIVWDWSLPDAGMELPDGVHLNPVSCVLAGGDGCLWIAWHEAGHFTRKNRRLSPRSREDDADDYSARRAPRASVLAAIDHFRRTAGPGDATHRADLERAQRLADALTPSFETAKEAVAQ